MDISSDKQTKSHAKTLDMANKRNLKRETESLLIAVQNNAIRTCYAKARIYFDWLVGLYGISPL